MSSFSSTWLALREPADHGAVNAPLREACARTYGHRRPLRIVDLGSGTGSNLRNLAPALGDGQHWTLVDHDAGLLDIARSRAIELARSGCDAQIHILVADLSQGAFLPIVAGADLVTASALFDLVSVSVIDALAASVTQVGAGFYTVLTYDGIASWLPEHPADAEMRAAFNWHQRTDKGFGPAAGPEATQALADAFSRRGYAVRRGKSPWVLDQPFSKLRQEVDRGWAAAVRETGRVGEPAIAAWLAHRLSARDAVTIVGHEDLLALPAGA